MNVLLDDLGMILNNRSFFVTRNNKLKLFGFGNILKTLLHSLENHKDDNCEIFLLEEEACFGREEEIFLFCVKCYFRMHC